ncbi:MAG: fliR [Betaproteobacteria bacterium]|nr:fliR [Betaproteobacteria bacterium]
MLSVTDAQLIAWVNAFLLPLARVLAMIATAPVLNHKSIPVTVKIGLGALIAALIAPTLPPLPNAILLSWNGILVLLQQIGVGVAFGFTLQLIFSGIEFAGDLIGMQMGLSFATMMNPQSGMASPVTGTFLSIIASLVFLSIDGHLTMVAAISESFHAFPIGIPSGGSALMARDLASMGGQVFSIALHLSLPVVAVLTICNLALGVMMRAAPQLNLMSIGFPISLLVGLWMMWICAPQLVEAMQGHLANGMAQLMR